jgi:hypothetical protein
MRKTVSILAYRCRQMITDGGVMGEFFCRGICGNPCESIAISGEMDLNADDRRRDILHLLHHLVFETVYPVFYFV